MQQRASGERTDLSYRYYYTKWSTASAGSPAVYPAAARSALQSGAVAGWPGRAELT